MAFVNVASFYKYFPSRVTVPVRLVELAEWLSQTINDDECYLPSFIGENFSEHHALNGSDLTESFGIFIGLGDGSKVAYWFYDGCDIDKAPIVVLGSEGDLGIAANSIEEFIACIIERQFPDTCWAARLSDFYLHLYSDDDEIESSFGDEANTDFIKPNGDWLVQLTEWVENNWSLDSESRQNLTSIDPSLNHPNIEKWFDDWNSQQESVIKDNIEMQEISSLLQEYITQSSSKIRSIEDDFYSQYAKKEQQRVQESRESRALFSSNNFDVYFVGSKFEIYHRFYGKWQLSNGEKFKPLFQKIRKKRAQEKPERGLWFSAWIKLYSSGQINITCHFDDQELNFEQEQPTLDDFLNDLNQFSKISKWIPDWLKNKLFKLALLEDRYEELIANYASFIELEDSDTEALLDRADLLAKYGKHESALQAYEKFISVDSQSYRAWYNRGNSLRSTNCFEESIQSYDRALNLEPDSAFAWYNRCLSFYDLKQYENALQSCDRALLIEPSKSEALYMKPYFLYYLKQYTHSLEICNQFLKIEPSNLSVIYLKCCILFYNLNQYEDVLEACEKGLLIEPSNHEMLDIKAHALFHLEQYNESIKLCE